MNTGHRYGYARFCLSTGDRDEQLHRLEASKCVHVFVENAVPVQYARHQSLQDYLKKIPQGGVLVATSLDRVIQSVDELQLLLADLRRLELELELLDYLGEARGVIETAAGIPLAALVDLERNVRTERRLLGIRKAKDSGKYKGRPASFDRTHAAELYEQGEPVEKLADRFNVTPRTIYRALSKSRG